MNYESILLFAAKFIAIVVTWLIVFVNILVVNNVVDWIKEDKKDIIDWLYIILASSSLVLLDFICVIGAFLFFTII